MPDQMTPPSGYNTPIPPQITTPDQVQTRIGTIEFDDGVPSPQTAERLYEQLDFQRAVEVFLQCIPAASLEAMHRGLVEMGCTAANKALIADRLMDSNPLFLTGNTDTVYATSIIDLERDGPTVVEIPQGCGPGTVNDAWFRFVIDMGAPGPDRGAGGTYLIAPTGYAGEAPDGAFVAESPSRINWLILRGFLVDGKPDAATEMFEQGVRIYPLSEAADPPATEWISISEQCFNTIHANDFSFYEEIAEVVQREPIEIIDPQTRGLLASIGIHKDRPFDPDPARRETLTEAAAVGNAVARAISFRPRDPAAYIYENRQWQTGFVGGDYQWLRGDGRSGRDFDARTLFFYMATVNTPAMALQMVGAGSQYGMITKDATGTTLDGGSAYRLHLPPEVPAKDFWSLVVYDPQTRSELQTGNPFPSINSVKDSPTYNDDGSIDLLFGPEAPDAGAENWIQTVSGKTWFALLRLYGPLEPWFEQTWVPSDIEPVEG